jgi:lysophospholipase L1-like esterase
VSRATRARRIALQAAYGGGGLGLIGAAVAAVLVSQAVLVRRAIPKDLYTPPESAGLYGAERDGVPLRFALIGDSTAAGLGADYPAQTPGALLAHGLSEALERPVEVSCPAFPGAQSQHLHAQVDQVLESKPDVVAILVGANDVIRRVAPSTAVRHLDEVVRQFIALDIPVVVATCPDLSQVESLRWPLRWIIQRWSRELAAAQTVAVVTAGGRTVSLADLLGDAFSRRPGELFSRDHFHPSPEGYRLVAEALLPSLLAAGGHSPALAGAPSAGWGSGEVPRQGVRSLENAAAEAASVAGTEVAPLPGAQGGAVAGLWGELRNRLNRITEWVPRELIPAALSQSAPDSEEGATGPLPPEGVAPKGEIVGDQR